MRTTLTIAATTACGAVVLGMCTPAQALPTNPRAYPDGARTRAIFTAGTGHIRAKQVCESSSGQTDWTSYGPWVGRGVNSYTGTCSIIRSRSYDVSN